MSYNFVGLVFLAHIVGDADATQAALTEAGYLRTGDLARNEGDGSFACLARMGDSLRLGGFMVEPSEIEAFIEQHVSVAVCQVVGIPGPRGIRPVAFVTAPAGEKVEEEALRAHCEEGLAGYKVPVRFFSA